MVGRVRVKVCGITNEDDALNAIKFGADALGFIFHEASPRHIDPLEAGKIIKNLPPMVSKVGLFVDADARKVEYGISQSGIDLLQFHGHELPGFCSRFCRPWIKTIKVGSETKFVEEMHGFQKASAFLFDSIDPELAGGTGHSFDWALIPKGLKKPFIVAGGLTKENVLQAIDLTSPFAVDVCSGIEAEKGKKDTGNMEEFITKVKANENHV